MASIFLRQKTWWLKLRHPVTGTVIRHSLETCDPARAELLRKRVELEISLLEPRFQVVDLPPRLRSGLGLNAAPLSACDAGLSQASTPPVFRTPTAPVRTTVDDAVAAYLRFIATENAPLHVANKISMLRRFLGAERVEKLGGPVKTKRRRTRDGKSHVPDPVPFFKGQFLDEILPVVVQDFLESLGVGIKTRRHYREFFHHFFEVCMKLNLYQPTNVRYPNPIGALPSYVKRNRAAIDFLKEAEVDAELALLLPEPAIRIAAALMIYAGLRRSEALWLTRDSISADLGYLSVLNRLDEEADLESSLKTGERSVTILPPLRRILESYLPGLTGKWVVPNPKGMRWRPDSFSKKLSSINRKAGLRWTCLHFRHTYATQRAAEGWTLFRVAKEMGNSVAVVEEYYAGYIRPA